MKRLKVTRNNYFDQATNNAYWSASLVKSMLTCPASALAELRGEYDRGWSTALTVGSYVDVMLTGNKTERAAWLDQHQEIYKRDGTLKADYVQAQEMVERAKSDPVFMSFLHGQKQKILTGTIGGLPFKSKLDVYVKGERIVDLKTVRDMRPVYVPGQGKLNFAQAWNWPLQMAIYQKLEGHRLPCYLAVITKENPPTLDVIQVDQDLMDAEMEFLLAKLPELDAMRQGIIEPERCEGCAYCRQTKKVIAPRMLSELEEIGGIEE